MTISATEAPPSSTPAAILTVPEPGQVVEVRGSTWAVAQVQQGNVRALAVTSGKRTAILPDVPTMAESGFPEIESDSWVGVLVPAGTPKDVVAILHREIVKILAQPDLQARLAALGYDVVASTPEQFATRIKTEIAMWAKVIRAANIKPI